MNYGQNSNLNNIEQVKITTTHTVSRKEVINVGRMKIISLMITLNSNIQAWTTIANFDITPNTSQYFPLILDYKYGIGYINSRGNFQVDSNLSSGSEIYGTFSIIV